MKHLVDELRAKADENIAAMRHAALRARDTHARAELMRRGWELPPEAGP